VKTWFFARQFWSIVLGRGEILSASEAAKLLFGIDEDLKSYIYKYPRRHYTVSFKDLFNCGKKD